MNTLDNSIYEVKPKGTKTSIKGLWKDEAGKIYIDNIALYSPSNPFDFEGKLASLFASGEKCIFVRGTDKAYIIYPDGVEITLSNRIVFFRERLSFNEVKTLLNIYGGITIFKITGQYVIEAWKE